jgi:hypothetical protein
MMINTYKSIHNDDCYSYNINSNNDGCTIKIILLPVKLVTVAADIKI